MEDKVIAKSWMLVGKHRPGKRLANVYINVEFRRGTKGVEVAFTTDLMSATEKHIGGGQHRGDDLRATLESCELEPQQFTVLMNIWDYWHLNGLRAGCEHQRAFKDVLLQNKIVGPEFFYANNYGEVVKLSGFGKCPECGYKYGSEWKHERIPLWITEIICDLFDMNVQERAYIEKALMAELAEAIKSNPMDINEQELLTMKHEPRVECGSCGAYHRESYFGDCRDDSERFADRIDEEEN